MFERGFQLKELSQIPTYIMGKAFKTISTYAAPFHIVLCWFLPAPSSIFNIFLMELCSMCNIVTGAELFLSILKAVAHVQQ